MVQHALATGALWLSAACGETSLPEQAAPVQSARAQALEGEDCSNDTTPPAVTCDAWGQGVMECGHLIRRRAVNVTCSDNCSYCAPHLLGYTYTSLGTIYTTSSYFDAAGNTGSCSTAWTVVDTVAPRLELKGAAEISIPVGSEYTDEGATPYDDCQFPPSGEGDTLAAQGTVNTRAPGTYILTYSLTDASGNRSPTLARTVHVTTTQSPSSTLTANTLQSHLRHTATRLSNGRVLVIGGYTRTAEEYNPQSKSWSAVGAPLTTHRGHTATELANGSVLVAGGAKVSSASLEETYDPATRQWTSTGRMSTVRYDHGAVRLPDGRVLVAGGGTGESSGGALASAEIYDSATRQWSATGPLIAARRNHTLTLLPGVGVLATGGVGVNGAQLSSAELYSFSTGTWTNVGRLATARSSHSATLLENGQVLVVGGQTSPASLGNSSELFNPTTSAWRDAGTMNLPRQNHAALLVKGEVLIVGGFNSQTGSLASTELFAPAQGPVAWRGFQAALKVDRYKHTVTALDANTVLVVAGTSSADPNATTAEVYFQP